MFPLISRGGFEDIRTLSGEEVEIVGSNILADFYAEMNRFNALRRSIAQLKRDGKLIQEESDQIPPIQEKINPLGGRCADYSEQL